MDNYRPSRGFTITVKMPWDGMFANLYPSKKSSIRRIVYKLSDLGRPKGEGQ